MNKGGAIRRRKKKFPTENFFFSQVSTALNKVTGKECTVILNARSYKDQLIAKSRGKNWTGKFDLKILVFYHLNND